MSKTKDEAERQEFFGKGGGGGAAPASQKEGGQQDENGRRYALVNFLRLKEQRSGVGALLRLHHGSEVHTVAEWGRLASEVLKIKCK